MAKKRVPLVNPGAFKRAGERKRTIAEGKCQFGDGPVQDVLLTNLDVYGCKLRGSAVGVTKSGPLTLWLGEVGPIAGRLRWARSGSVGIAFDVALDEATLSQVCEVEPGPTVVPMRRRAVS